MDLTGKQYQEWAARTINTTLSNHFQELHALHGMVGEIGEIHSIYQKVYQGHEIDENHLQSEVGDLLWFIAELCTAKGWNLDSIMIKNIMKLQKRYPEGFTVEESLHRAEGDI